MDGNHKVLAAAISAAPAFLAVGTVIASSQTVETPFYTVRMEQASSKMDFLPTAVTTFTYTAESGYTVHYDVTAWCGGKAADITEGRSCDGTCYDPTCPLTCNPTCDSSTCDTCEGYTCEDTSCQLTCDTCTNTCGFSCWETCPPCR
jgi:hypothetical protein